MTSNGLAEAPLWVLDSFAVISLLWADAGAARVSEVLEGAGPQASRVLLSEISLAEIAYITERRGGLSAAQAALSAVQDLSIELAEVDRKTVLAAAHVKARHPISLADAFVVALALAEDGTILTGDPEFRFVRKLVRVEWLPR